MRDEDPDAVADLIAAGLLREVTDAAEDDTLLHRDEGVPADASRACRAGEETVVKPEACGGTLRRATERWPSHARSATARQSVRRGRASGRPAREPGRATRAPGPGHARAGAASPGCCRARWLEAASPGWMMVLGGACGGGSKDERPADRVCRRGAVVERGVGSERVDGGRRRCPRSRRERRRHSRAAGLRVRRRRRGAGRRGARWRSAGGAGGPGALGRREDGMCGVEGPVDGEQGGVGEGDDEHLRSRVDIVERRGKGCFVERGSS